MALHQLLLSTPLSHVSLVPGLVPVRAKSRANVAKNITCLAYTQAIEEPKVVRRSGNFLPSLYDHNLLQSLKSECEGDAFKEHHGKLKEDARNLLKSAIGLSPQLELINDIQRLGIQYHFELEIKEMLNTISASIDRDELGLKEDLYTTALCFRLLRQHGYKVTEDVFKVFMDEMGHFKTNLCRDTRGLLSLYEASQLGFAAENILVKAKEFALEHLKDVEGKIDQELSKLVEHSLEFPLHWRIPRAESRWYIDLYETKEYASSILNELAKLDFNVVQAIHQNDLSKTLRWWRKLGLANKLNFARDRIVESFLWTIGICFEPQFNRCRDICSKVIQLVTLLDDIYDVYGLMDELEILTDVIDRWDISEIENLPEYMRIFYLALFNTINDFGYEIMKEQGVNVIPYLKTSWADLCKADLREAKWLQSGYQPTLSEFLNNGWVSVSGPVVLTQVYFSMDQNLTREALEVIEKNAHIIKTICIIFRLTDDMGTSSDELKRGDVPKSIQCYMHESGASEVTAREHIKSLISEYWKKLTEDLVEVPPHHQPFVNAAVNFARMATCTFENGDGFGSPNVGTETNIKSLLIEPIPYKKM